MTTETSARERPVIFSAESVRAILDGTKTQTRRVMRPQPAFAQTLRDGRHETCPDGGFDWGIAYINCPFGAPGDRLWVRETCLRSGDDFLYADHDDYDICYPTGKPYDLWRVCPSIFLPRWASRISLTITDVRVQRVQEISDDDAKAEGATAGESSLTQDLSGTARGDFARIWNELNSSRGHGWDTNPWVWALTFRPLLSAEDPAR